MHYFSIFPTMNRAAGRRGAWALQFFAVDPITTRGAGYAHQIITGPPDFRPSAASVLHWCTAVPNIEH